ncbi:MAG: hypothetical protein ACD_60C00087G0014 [uncultured bacterium]|nr:MAG: hypothetical protein ACD_60C00087G0014 [uncultured bacterium]
MLLHNLGGTIRTRVPSETLEITKPYIEKAGISRIANITGLDCLNIPVYTCYRPNSKNLSTSQGKGLTDELALCSAIMEAIEHYYAENIKIDCESSFNKLSAQCAVDPNQLMLGFTKLKNIHEYVLNWRKAKNLFDNSMLLIPTDYINLDLTSVKLETGIFIRSTTGLASGNTREEAILHALFEIFERNCLFEFKKLRIREKQSLLLDINTVNDKYVAQLMDKLVEKNITVAIFDITNRFDIPTYHCIISDNSPIRKLGHQSGTGTHLSKNIALCRAITEAAQSRLTHISGARDDMFPMNYQYEWKNLGTAGVVNYQCRSSIETSNTPLDKQINYLLNIFNNNGYDKLVCVDHTSNDESIAVVHVVVLGLNT